MTAPQMENRSSVIAGSGPGEQTGAIEHPYETIPGYVKPIPGKAERFGTGGEPTPGIANAEVWARSEGATPQAQNGRFIAGKQAPLVGERQGEYCRLTETPEFKDWFGDSKVVFNEGESDRYQNPDRTPGIPRMVYYGTPERLSSDLLQPDERGAILFSANPYLALQNAGNGGEVIPAYLKIENPLIIKSTGATSIGDAEIDKAREQGNDGIIFDYLHGNYKYAVFLPDQVKSPLNRGIFEQDDSGILNKANLSNVEDTTIGKTFQIEQEIEKKPVEIIGLQMTDHGSLARLAQVWRNPNYEEARYVYVRDGIIVDHEGVTCRLPMMTQAFLGDSWAGIWHIKERIAALDADSIFAVHNHPNGDPKPSEKDLKLTVFIANLVPEMKGHIIINSRMYGFIDPKGEYETYDLPGLPEKWIDPILTPSVSHEMLDKEFKWPEEIAAWVKVLTSERNKPLIVYLSSVFKVRGLQEINPGGNRDWKQLADIMPKKLLDFGSTHAVLILPERSRGYMLEIGEPLVRQGVFYDVVSFDKDGPHSVREKDISAEEKRFGGRPLSDFPARSIR